MDLAYLMIAPVLLGPMVAALLLVWWERRLLGFWQDRLGPNRLGPFGILQMFADVIKLLTKDDWIPPFSDRVVFTLAPTAIVAGMLMGFAVVPYGPGLHIIDLNIGLLFFLAMTSLAVYGVLLGGLASNNKYSLLGGLRSAAQMVTYEVFMGLSIMGVVMLTGTFNLNKIVHAQEDGWFFIPQFVGLVVFMIAGIAEAHRLPFDLPEAEHELAAGFHTEYSGMKIRPDYGRRVSILDPHVGHYGNAVLRWLAGAGFPSSHRLVFAENRFGHLLLHTAAGGYSAAAIRPADVARMENSIAAHTGELASYRSGSVELGGLRDVEPVGQPWVGVQASV